ncbi:acyl-CoA dehydrogenase family protein [Candidatus Entotheonella palauensis]|uniref:Acyl-CoA dehydrogenase n=1 Tax=Candidatus Entotheonella gemina TaxID=1429439 RepID=W4M3U0_9BACT|nr:acyl-CoA dehydrogenase family protein [Candidatus Entotheonella palauensis]ETX04282.1 MAG: acyl-CoA dehydrogenase [Candidatus Entotheonella gemina]
MDMQFTPEDLAFRDEVRQFIADEHPKDLLGIRYRQHLKREEMLAWHQILYKKGWIAPNWPVEYGGTGWTPMQRYIFSEECARAETVTILPFGLNMVGPVIYTFGSPEQKERFLPKILSAEHWWCQGYSEPEAGSDLASLRTTAVLDGDEYVINGQKTWTTLAQFANWIFVLARTDPEAKPQAGISFFLVDMNTPGVSVRPIKLIDGSYEVNDTFFDNVRVPRENMIGEANRGWTYAKFLLGHERVGIAGVARSKTALGYVRDIAAHELVDGVPLAEDDGFAAKLAEVEIDLTALEFTELRALAAESQGHAPGAEASILKIRGTEIQQRITELAVEAVAHYGFPKGPSEDDATAVDTAGPEYAVGAVDNYLQMRKTSIYGGSNEIQRNIIAKMVLGL